MTETWNVESNCYATLDNLKEGIQLISFDWRYLYLNNVVIKHSKYQREELLGFTMTEKYPGIENTQMFKVLEECMGQRITRHIENKFVYPDNSYGWFDLSIQPVPQGIFVLSIDITKRKEAEKMQHQHLEKLEEMMFITSHNVRQPIANILGLTYLLDKVFYSPSELNKLTDYIKQSAISLDNLAHEMTSSISKLKQKAAKKNWI